MKRCTMSRVRFLFGTLAAVLVLSASAQAGPPLICHPIAIGASRSLPWGSGSDLAGDPNYDLKNLVRDTLSILDSNAPVLARMETLRRSTLYARRDPQAAKELLTRLYSRATHADAAGRPDALASFDLGYLIECYKQWLGQNLPHMTDGMRMDSNPAAGLDGYTWVNKAISLRGEEPEMEFAAALITLGQSQRNHQEHVQKAVAGAKRDPLLAENLARGYFADVFGKVTTAEK
jgi:hypothetical protein